MNPYAMRICAGTKADGTPCPRRCMAPHTHCEAHRPKPKGGHKRDPRRESQVRAMKKFRDRRSAGVPEGWDI